ncbi:MAG: hypothetical protein KIG44_05375 [Eubacteriales bacterium]|nr:hypothetical protein [Eubacteriales bacterium]
MTVLFFEKKSRQKKLQLSGSITAPLCKGSSAAGGEGLFLQPFHHFVVPLHLHRGGEIRTPLAERREGGSRRLTDEVYFCKRNFDYRGVCADFSLSVQTGFIKIKAEVIFSSLFLFCTKFSGSVCANEPDEEGRKIFAIK